jgi:hypothetical protein
MTRNEATRWAAADARWFIRHPGRNHRLRRPFEGETPDESGHVVVWQILPGFRMRFSVRLVRPTADGEETARALFDEVLPMLHLSEGEYREFAQAAGMRDACQGCGRPYQSGEPTILGLGENGRPIDVGSCCPHRLRARAGFGFYFAARDCPPSILARIEPRGSA